MPQSTGSHALSVQLAGTQQQFEFEGLLLLLTLDVA
jgi:hypothetical protein